MNHKLIYGYIISKAKSENRKKYQGIYYENHHIIPSCLGGSNLKENKVLLTAREHFICHKLLVEIYPESKGLIYSLLLMMRNDSNTKMVGRKYKVSSREYERLRIIYSKTMKGKSYEEIFGEEAANYMKLSKSGCKNFMFGKTHGEEALSKIKVRTNLQTLEGKHPFQAQDEFGVSLYGAKSGKDHFLYGKKQKRVICEYCGKEVDMPNYKRWHSENCKLKQK